MEKGKDSDLSACLGEGINWLFDPMTLINPTPQTEASSLSHNRNVILLQQDSRDEGKFSPLIDQLLNLLKEILENYLFLSYHASSLPMSSSSFFRKLRNFIIPTYAVLVGQVLAMVADLTFLLSKWPESSIFLIQKARSLILGLSLLINRVL